MAFKFYLPDIGEGVIEGEIVSWKVAVGDKLALDQPMVEIMTDKATVEIPSPRAGTVAEINFAEGEICPVGDVLLVIDEDGDAGSPDSPAAKPSSSNGNRTHSTPEHVQVAAAPPQVIDVSAERARIKAAPGTRRLARKLNVELARVPATGKHGRVTSDDVRRFADGATAMPAAAAAVTVVGGGVTSAPASPISVPASGQEKRIPFRGMRRRIAEAMARSTRTAAHFTYVEEIDVTELVAVRARAKARAAERGIKITYLPFIVKAIVAGLKKWPSLNASLDETTNEIVLKGYYHLGIAAQGPTGLVVTVLRDADKRSIFDIAVEIQRLADAVQNGTATRDDLTGSTFTISSLGKLGGLLATPIINFPEVGIVGVHKIAERPVVRNGEIVIASIMNLSISLDHRLVDGWDGAMFLQDVKTLLEDPTLMFMEMV